MEFLADITVRIPADLPEEERESLIAAERARGRELVAAGTIREIWRVPGAIRNLSVWEAADATELHALLSSLPTFRFAEIVVTPLAAHPLKGGPENA